jgi:hypothetical protein
MTGRADCFCHADTSEGPVTRRIIMRHNLSFAVIWLVGSVACQAQSGPTPGMGATSPLGTSPSNAPSADLIQIPLGVTELNPGGLSPLVAPCPSASSNAAFDGGGSMTSAGCSSTTSTNSTGTSAAFAPSGSTPASAAQADGTGIPLGSTELATPGESPIITNPMTPVAPCPSVLPSAQNTAASGC